MWKTHTKNTKNNSWTDFYLLILYRWEPRPEVRHWTVHWWKSFVLWLVTCSGAEFCPDCSQELSSNLSWGKQSVSAGDCKFECLDNISMVVDIKICISARQLSWAVRLWSVCLCTGWPPAGSRADRPGPSLRSWSRPGRRTPLSSPPAALRPPQTHRREWRSWRSTPHSRLSDGQGDGSVSESLRPL